LEPVTRIYFDLAEKYTAVQIEDARAAFFRAARSMAKFQTKYDVILTPTLATPPIEHGRITMTGTSQAVLQGLLDFMPCTQMANWTGQPAMSVPLHQTSDGLPVGVQFFARHGDETTLFRLAGQLEEARPWAGRRPDL
ncbi:MAG: amidase family protein, partial [Pirellulaceae bacterium]